MNRLQKKCVIATVGIHLLLILILVFGSAFFSPRPKPDDTQLLDYIPANLIDAAFNSGVKGATPPAPTPMVVPPPQPAPPTPTIQPPPPVPKPTLTEKLEKIFTPEPKPEPVKPAPTETKPEHKIQPNLTPTVRVAPKNPPANPKPDNSRAINNAIKNLKTNLKPGPVVDMPGEGTAAYANYKDALATIYYNAWTTPSGAANDEADTIVKITIASDGTVINARIITPSGDEKTDASVRSALDRVSSVPPLPDKSKTQQEFTIDFNLKTKRTLE